MRVWLHAELDPAPGVDLPALAAWLAETGAPAIRAAGGVLHGLFRPETGEAPTLLTAWPDDALAGAAIELLKASTRIVAVRGTPLHPLGAPPQERGDAPWTFRRAVLAPGQTADGSRGAFLGPRRPDGRILLVSLGPEVDLPTLPADAEVLESQRATPIPLPEPPARS
ncbi:MAG: hypothetical protein V2J02_12620 [Pseudomonadales bacterium]|jgi:hypothetical protein|nr:hypothetical protein [Pseudomonadales bacterium]